MKKQNLQTTRFGCIQYSEEEVLFFEEGLIGFPFCKSFLIVQHKEGSLFQWLQSTEREDLAFLVVDPKKFVPEFSPEINSKDLEHLDLDKSSNLDILTTVRLKKKSPPKITLNLAGPILINSSSRRAKQVILEDNEYGAKYEGSKEIFLQGKAA